MIDAEALIYALLQAGKPPGVTVLPELNLDSIDSMPLVLFQWRGEGQTSNGPGLWTGTLDLTVIAADIDAAKATAASFYDLVWSWSEDPASAIVTDVGWVSDVSDVTAFDRTDGSLISARGVAQYDGSFSLDLRN